MSTGFTAIIPKSYLDPNKARASADAFLKAFAVEAQRQLQKYPEAQPWKSPPPRTGLRAGGKRTGNYGRGWASYVLVSGVSVKLENKVSYGIYVGGPTDQRPGQARFMGARGWPSVTKVGQDALKKAMASVKMTA